MKQCENCQYNMEILKKIKTEVPDEETVSNLSEIFKIFGNETRIRVLWTLFDEEMCVYDISHALDMSQSAISHQLRILKKARLVRARRDGKNTFYSLDDDHVKRIIEQGLIHIAE